MSDNNPDGGLLVDQVVLDEKLSKIRLQINSNLENQKHLAIILAAVEENIQEQNNELTPVSYFVSFLSLLEQAIQNDVIVDKSLATSTAYFLDIICPFTPKPLLRSKFVEILIKLAPALSNPEADAPLIRSTIGALESLLLSQDQKNWKSSGNTSPKRALLGLLELSFDPRPKVRKRAQEAVKQILINPPTTSSNSNNHVAAPLACDIALNKLTSLIADSKKNRKNKEFNSQIIHCLQLISAITSSNAWPSTKIEQLSDILLEISKTSDQYLVSTAFAVFEGLFKSMSSQIDSDKFNNALNIIFDLKPSINDTHLAASWLAVVAKALESYAILSSIDCIKKIPTIVPIVSEFLGSDSKDIYSSAAQCLIAIISQANSDDFLLQPTATNGISNEIYELMDETISWVAEHIEKELLSIKYQAATKEILEFINACILKYRSRCNPDFLAVLEIVGDWRTNEATNFPYNKEAEDIISSSISTIGPQPVLSVLPLNLTGGSPGRAWLLPLLRDNVRVAELQFFKTDILPAVEFFEKKIEESENKESMNNKIFQTIIDQIWSLLPHFCDLPKDLRTSFDEKFATYLSNLMYSKVELRQPICHALRLLVESNLAYSEGAMSDDLLIQEQFPIAEAKTNIEYLGSIASNLLSVLFNVFSSTSTDSRNFVLETIDAYLQVISKEDLENTFNKVCGLLKNAMDEESTQTSKKTDNSLSITMMDLIVSMAKYVPESCHNALFSIFTMTVSLKDNNLMQKRAYRIIAKMAESDFGKNSIINFIDEIVNVLLESTQITHTSARAPRLQAIMIVLNLLPKTHLYFIPAILQEAIMSTKDVNEKTRELSYQILIQLGHKMSEGGIVENGKVPGFDPESPATEASLSEYFTMVSAGLAAETPHMISATITAVSCLVFEFKDQLPTEILLELSSTIELYLTHNSREIAKSAIGFVKVEVLSLPEDMVKANLKGLLSKLMRWSHEHKGHFKSKVKHILERLIRKFGIDEIENNMPEEDRKLIVNIKKTKNRAKRKQEEEGETNNEDSSSKKFVSAYEEALYDSEESDFEDSEKPSKGNKRSDDQFIMETGDDPMNLLDHQTLAQISSSKPKKFGKKDLQTKVNDFKTKNGKIVFSEADDNEDPLVNKVSGIDAYVDAIKQAPIRGQKNKLKFKKSSNDDQEDWSDDDSKQPERPTKNKIVNKVGKSRIQKPKQKFKAKRKL